MQIVMSVGSIAADTPLPYAAASFNKVVSVDAAYHFKTRERFVVEASRTLVVGGGLVVADMILREPFKSLSWRKRCCLRVVATAAGIPLANMVNDSEYVEMLHRHGFGTQRLPRCFSGYHRCWCSVLHIVICIPACICGTQYGSHRDRELRYSEYHRERHSWVLPFRTSPPRCPGPTTDEATALVEAPRSLMAAEHGIHKWHYRICCRVRSKGLAHRGDVPAN